MGKSYLCPLFWQHHEGEDELRNEIRAMDENGIKSFVVEARPHPHYLKAEWWSDLSILIDEAKKRDMGVWIFDDGSYPSGYADGLIQKYCPQYTKKYLAHNYVDAIGPKRGSSVLVNDWLGEGERLLCVIAGRRTDGLDRMDMDTYVDITDYVHDGILYWNIPEGEWRIFIFKVTKHGGEDWTKNYLNPLDPEGPAAFVRFIYEEHYRHFKQEFGRTIRGFFTDEPRFGNASSYHNLPGEAHTVLPWSDTLLEELSQRGFGDFKTLLPALFYESGEKTPDVRFVYMDVVSKRFSKNFLGQLGDWCREHGVRLIGHVIEENGAHARLGFGPAHYFRSMEGMDAAGIDVVDNIYPGRTGGKFLTAFHDFDAVFNHWGLSKMASSAAHLDPKKNGTALCEAFGAYGWSEGLKTMKWITDAMCVRGINAIVPHAFSPKAFPDPDCPPHFYAGGNNPQFPFFHIWSDYANRVCDRISGGVHVAPVAVLYHAEAEWGGEYEPFEKVVKTLMQGQIDCDVIPADVLSDEKRCRTEKGVLNVNKESYRALIVPYSQYLPPEMERVFGILAKNDIPVIFVKDYPARYYFGAPFKTNEGMCRVNPDELVPLLRERGIFDIRLTKPCGYLVYYHYRKAGKDSYFFTNEDLTRNVCAEIIFRDPREAALYDPMTGRWYSVGQTRNGDKCQVKLSLAPYESAFIVFGEEADVEPIQKPEADSCEIELPEDGWEISVRDYKPGSDFISTPYHSLGNFTSPDRMPDFSGTIRYERTFVQPGKKKLRLSLGEAYESVRVSVNGVPIGERICPPYSFAIPADVMEEGENRLTVEVTNTLAKRWHNNGFDRYWVQDPSGLLGPVKFRILQ